MDLPVHLGVPIRMSSEREASLVGIPQREKGRHAHKDFLGECEISMPLRFAVEKGECP